MLLVFPKHWWCRRTECIRPTISRSSLSQRPTIPQYDNTTKHANVKASCITHHDIFWSLAATELGSRWNEYSKVGQCLLCSGWNTMAMVDASIWQFLRDYQQQCEMPIMKFCRMRYTCVRISIFVMQHTTRPSLSLPLWVHCIYQYTCSHSTQSWMS